MPHDLSEAMAWYHRSAEQGYLKAQIALSDAYFDEMHRDFKGVPKDKKKAEKWLTKAAEQGDVGSQRRLASRYRHPMERHGQGAGMVSSRCRTR